MESMLKAMENLREAGVKIGRFTSFNQLRESLSEKTAELARKNRVQLVIFTEAMARYGDTIKKVDREMEAARELVDIGVSFGVQEEGQTRMVAAQIERVEEFKNLLLQGLTTEGSVTFQQNLLDDMLSQLKVSIDQAKVEQARLDAIAAAEKIQDDRRKSMDQTLSLQKKQLSILKQIETLGLDQSEIFEGVGKERFFDAESLKVVSDRLSLIRIERAKIAVITFNQQKAERDALALQQAAFKEKEDELTAQNKALGFLRQQEKIISAIARLGFDPDTILGGFQVGATGDPNEFLEVRTRLAAAQTEELEAQLAAQSDLFALEQARADLAEKQASLKFLQDQQKLLADIVTFGFDETTILDGFQVGADANMSEFLEVMGRFTDAMIGQVEDDLGIASPSKVFMKIGQQTMQGLTQGIMSMSQVPGQVMSAATNLMTQRASAPNVSSAQTNTFNTTINSQMDAAQFQAMLNRSLSNAIA